MAWVPFEHDPGSVRHAWHPRLCRGLMPWQMLDLTALEYDLMVKDAQSAASESAAAEMLG